MVQINPPLTVARSQFGFKIGTNASDAKQVCLLDAYNSLQAGDCDKAGIYNIGDKFYFVNNQHLEEAMQDEQPGLIVMERKFDFKA